MPNDTQILQDKDFLAAPQDQQIKYLSSVDKDFARASKTQQESYIKHLKTQADRKSKATITMTEPPPLYSPHGMWDWPGQVAQRRQTDILKEAAHGTPSQMRQAPAKAAISAFAPNVLQSMSSPENMALMIAQSISGLRVPIGLGLTALGLSKLDEASLKPFTDAARVMGGGQPTISPEEAERKLNPLTMVAGGGVSTLVGAVEKAPVNKSPNIVDKWLQMSRQQVREASKVGQKPGEAISREIAISRNAESAADKIDTRINELRTAAKTATENATRRGDVVDLSVSTGGVSKAPWRRPRALGPGRQLSGTVNLNKPMFTGLRPGGGQISDVIEQAFTEKMADIYKAKGAMAYDDPVFKKLQELHEQYTNNRNMARLTPDEVDSMLKEMDEDIRWSKKNQSAWEKQLAKARHEIAVRFHKAVPEVAKIDAAMGSLLEGREHLQNNVLGKPKIFSFYKALIGDPTVTSMAFATATGYLLHELGLPWQAYAPAILGLRTLLNSTPSVLTRAKLLNLLDDVLNVRVNPSSALIQGAGILKQSKTQGGTPGGIGRPPAPSAPSGGPGPGLPPGPGGAPTGGGQGPTSSPPPPQIGGAQMGVPAGGTPPVSPTRPGVAAPELPPYRMGGVEVKTAPEGASGVVEPAPKTGAERQARYRASEKGRVKEPVRGEAAEIAIEKEARAPGATAQDKLEAMDVGLQALELKYGPRGKQIADAIRLLYKGKRIPLDGVLDAIENANQKLSKSPR